MDCYSCPECDTTCTTKYSLQIHVRTKHKKEVRFGIVETHNKPVRNTSKCKYFFHCFWFNSKYLIFEIVFFSDQGELKKYVEAVSEEKKESRFACSLCGTSSNKKGNIKRHIAAQHGNDGTTVLDRNEIDVDEADDGAATGEIATGAGEPGKGFRRNHFPRIFSTIFSISAPTDIQLEHTPPPVQPLSTIEGHISGLTLRGSSQFKKPKRRPEKSTHENVRAKKAKHKLGNFQNIN